MVTGRVSLAGDDIAVLEDGVHPLEWQERGEPLAVLLVGTQPK